MFSSYLFEMRKIIYCIEIKRKKSYYLKYDIEDSHEIPYDVGNSKRNLH